MNLHKYTKDFIRLLKEECMYNAFIEGVRNKYHTNCPIQTLDGIIISQNSLINKDRYLSSLIDICFNWNNAPLSMEHMDALFFKATKTYSDLNYSKK